MKTKLSELASIAEIVASIGVILTLLFVGLELQEGNRETRATTTQLVIKAEMDMVAVFVANAKTWDKVVTGAPLAEGEEMRTAINLFQLSMLETANRYAQYRSGYIDSSSWDGTLKALPAVMKLPVYEVWRESFGGQGQDTAFLELLDGFSPGK
jgi:hypothetical protein